MANASLSVSASWVPYCRSSTAACSGSPACPGPLGAAVAAAARLS